MSENRRPLIEMTGIVKDFPGVRALDHVSFSVRRGEIHGLVGENGAGKTTLVKILAGVYKADEGKIRIAGEIHEELHPRQVDHLGVQFIHQERYLVPHFSVAQSIFLGREPLWGGAPFVDNGAMREEAEAFLEQMLGISLPADTLIRDLTVAQAQIVQIAKALMGDPSVIVLDEPTAPLTRGEVERLFDILVRLRRQGIAVIYISHYLQEIAELCERVTVLRNGQNVGTLSLDETTTDDVAALMVGRELKEMFPPRDVEVGNILLKVDHLTLDERFRDISFEVRQGEVIGVTGLLGSGKEALAETLFGLETADSGAVSILGQTVKALNPVLAVDLGMGLVPRDRRRQGLVMDASVSDNISLAALEQVSRFGFVQPSRLRERARQMVDGLRIATPALSEIVRYLSGGNQQKVVVGRWLNSAAKVYLLDEPTAGVDIGAKVEVYRLINRLVADGAGVVLVSSDVLELLGIADRVLVMYRGSVVKSFDSSDATPDALLAWATGGGQAS